MQAIRNLWSRGVGGKLILIAAGGFGVFALCCVLLVVVALVMPTSQSAARPTSAVRVTSVAAIEPSVAPTAIPISTDVPTLTPTDLPTNTPEPTATPTPTEIPTNTPVPAQQTAQAKANATATIVALDAEYPEIDIRDLVKGPDRYQDQKFHLRGVVFTIREETGLLGGVTTTMQIWVQIPGGNEFDREAVVVRFEGTLEKVFEDSPVIVYGTGAGSFEGTNAFGAKITQPGMDAVFVRY